jgi:nucleoside-diphosphate-sugar epimerase
VSLLVTGATGFIGREVVRRLLAIDRSVVVLARGRDGAKAHERVVSAIGPLPTSAALEIVEGDLVSPGCGLARGDWRRLRGTVETVINCAGDTRFEPEEIEPYVAAHIDGPRRLIEGLAGGRLTRWAQVSTAFVCGRRSGTILEREGDVG